MLDESTLNEIQEINLTYLLLAQKIIKSDLPSALVMLNINQDVADMISSLKVGEMMEMSKLNQLICQFRAVSDIHISAILRKDRDQGFNSIHAALVFSSPEASKSLDRVNI